MKTPRRGLGLGVYKTNVLEKIQINGCSQCFFIYRFQIRHQNRKVTMEIVDYPPITREIDSLLSVPTAKLCGVKISLRKSRTFRITRAEPEV